jgi:hypothetical protein
MSDFAGMDHEFQLENTNDSDFLDDDQFHLTLEALAEDEEPSERRVAAVEAAPLVPLAAPVQPTAAATTAATTDWSVPWIMAQLQQEMMRQQPWFGVLASTTTTAVPLWNAAAPPLVWPNTGLALPPVSAPVDPLPTALAAAASVANSTVSGTVASATAPLRTAAPAPRKRKRKEPRHQPTSVVAWDDEEDEDHSHISENEDESAQRRRERNAREQQRSQHITTQIAQLRTVLEDAQVRATSWS